MVKGRYNCGMDKQKEYTVHYQNHTPPYYRQIKLADYLGTTTTLPFTSKRNGINRKGVIVNPEINFFHLQTWGLDYCHIETLLNENELFELLRKQGYDPIWVERNP